MTNAMRLAVRLTAAIAAILSSSTFGSDAGDNNHYILECGGFCYAHPSNRAAAAGGFFAIDEIYSNSDGSVQFVLMNNVDSTSLAGRTLVARNKVDTHVYVFPNDLPAGAINHLFLVATQGFADLGLVKPDYIVPNGFLFYPTGAITIGDEFAYTGLPTDGVHAFWGDPDLDRIDFAVARAENFAGDTYTFSATPRANFSFGGLWWNAPTGSETGWGIAVEHQGDAVFATWATYDDDGSPVRFVIPRAVFRPNRGIDYFGPNTYQGAMYRMVGPALGADRFDSSKVRATPAGVGGFHFDPAGDSLFFHGSRPENGLDTRYKSITQAIFADPMPVCTEGLTPAAVPNYQGMWWNPEESGWGLHLTHQGDILFAIWFTYDTAGKATWLVMTATRAASANTYSGAVYRGSGPAYRAVSYEQTAVTATVVGKATLAFSGRDDGAFAYSVDGVQQTKIITRGIFADRPTVCNE
jgi:hypothetical protein